MGAYFDARPLIERIPIDDTSAHDLGRIDVFENQVRLVFFAEQFDEEGGHPVRVIGRGHKLMLPRCVLVPAIGRVLFSLGELTGDGLTNLFKVARH